MNRFLIGCIAAFLLAMGGIATADIMTHGKVFISADKTAYIGWDGTSMSFVVNGAEVFNNSDLAKIDGVTAGTVTASKAVVVDASKNIGTFGDVAMAGLTATTGTFSGAVGTGALTATTVAGTTGTFTGRVTTTDGVASGTAKVVGGKASSAILATDNLLASAGASAHVDFAQTYSIPANTLNSGSVMKISGSVNATDASGTDTLEVKVYLGSTTLVTTTAFDPDAAADFVLFECEITSRAAASATSALVGKCNWMTEDGTTHAVGGSILPTTNFATNGALVVKASAAWSATTASTNARLETFNVTIW